MSKEYTECPTCGGLCYYPSNNFKQANVKLNALSFTEIEREFKYALDRINHLEDLLNQSEVRQLLGAMTVDELWRAFRIKARGFELVTFKDILRDNYPGFWLDIE